MYLEKAKAVIKSEYDKSYVGSKDKRLIALFNEKIHHSYQVLGAGKYLLKHEAYFSGCSAEETDFLQAVVLLHDVARFYEFSALEKGIKIDHGVCGSEMLKKIPEFNKIEAVLAVKHHGHLIERLYEDEEYSALSPETQQRVQKVTFLVRDADKIANFYLLVSQFDEMSVLFFSERSYATPFEKKVCVAADEDFNNHITVNMKNITNFAERAIGFLSWIFDLNYKTSFIFLDKLNLVERMCDCFSNYLYAEDLAKYRAEMQKYVKQKLQ